ncbi:MAG TPA: phosphate signaling complex protein PhoU [Candidatus Blautia faecipullorum]|nr:phosphate signaling complex protein PhoU [Candidatus Blautia faecipullorum]
MATRFERQLEELHVQMITMGSLCEKVIKLSAKAIEGEDCAGQVFETDREIDAKEREIETLCMRLLLHQQPVAGDLREISAALRMISDMERIGDQAADIADLSRFIDRDDVQVPDEIKKMVEQTVHMVTESVDAFVKSDINLCRKVIADDDKVDEAFNNIKGQLAGLMHGNMDVKVGIDLLMAAKYMERIGDHAVNIAEWVEYSITGVHRNNEHQLGGN